MLLHKEIVKQDFEGLWISATVDALIINRLF